MSAFINFFTKRFRRRPTAPAPSHIDESSFTDKKRKIKKSDIECKVAYLDGTEHTFFLSKHALGSELYDISFAYIALTEEKDYFGLRFYNKIPIWLDPTKEIMKQCKVGPPYSFSMLVKFFASNPHNLHDEYTRYLLVLQLREDIRTGKLPCTDFQLATELAALLLQAELGDYDPKQHTLVLISKYRFVPDEQQTEEFELTVLEKYKSLSRRNLTPAAAESLYLEKVRFLPDYGVEMHKVKGKDHCEYSLGLTPTGILVYEGRTKIGLFFWPKILKLEMNGNKLKIVVADEGDDKTRKSVIEHTFCFVLPDKRYCKTLWKNAVECHMFFRLTDRSCVPHKNKQLFRLRSRFHASFNTEYQLHNLNMFGSSSFRKRKTGGSSIRATPIDTGRPTTNTFPNPKPGTTTGQSSFRRVPSKKFTPRPSFLNRENFNDRRAKRERLLQDSDQITAVNDEHLITNLPPVSTTQATRPNTHTLHEIISKTEPQPQFMTHVTSIPNSQHSPIISGIPSKPPRLEHLRNNMAFTHPNAQDCFEFTV